MNILQAMRGYIRGMARSTTGMKVLLLDEETAGMVSVVYSQSEMMQEEVYLFEDIRTPKRELMGYIKAVVLLRPTEENLRLLRDELSAPRYGEYHLFFTNSISSEYLSRIASADEYEVVQNVEENFGDYYVINSDFFSLGLPSCLSSKEKNWPSSSKRIEDGLFGILASLRINPVIRVQKSSRVASEVGNLLLSRMEHDSDLLKTKRTGDTLLLIIDRKDDPVTPLLTPWSYQAMLHGSVGIENNVLELESPPGATKSLFVSSPGVDKSHSTHSPEKMVLSAYHDGFYADNRFKDFGEVCDSLKGTIDSYREEAASHQLLASDLKSLESLGDIRAFLSSYTDLKKVNSSVDKHWKLIKEIQRSIDDHRLLDVSEFEQRLACCQDQEGATERLEEFISDDRFLDEDVLRLVILYSLRYEGQGGNNAQKFIDSLRTRGLSDCAAKDT